MVNLDEELKCWPKASLEEITREAFRVDDGGIRQKLAHFLFEARNAQATEKLLDEQRAAVRETRSLARSTVALAVFTAVMAAATWWMAIAPSCSREQAPAPVERPVGPAPTEIEPK